LLSFFAHPAHMERLGIRRLECLDGLRGLLAVYVLLGHMAPFAVLPDTVQDSLSHGGAAVDVFFMLSGLVITQSLLHTRGLAKPFLIARAARIFPVFLLVFAVAVAAEPWSCGFDRMAWIGPDDSARTICVMTWPPMWAAEITAHLTMTHGLFPNGVMPDAWVSFLGSSWSLSTEWQFYLVALIAVGGYQRRRLNAERSSDDRDLSAPIIAPHTLCWVLLGLAVAGTAWRLSVPDIWQFSRAFLPNKAHFFALGVASVAVVRRERGALGRYGLVLATSLAICATQETIGKVLPPVAWTLCLGVQMLPERRGLRLVSRLLRSPAAQYLGTISYCLYLVNEPIHKVTAAVLSHVANGNPALFTLLWLPAAVGLPILASIWLHTHVEAPALRWGRSWADNVTRDRDAQTAGLCGAASERGPSVQAEAQRL
jgi:peptidoglycan/LPS O-acetylase OafA/YrhL